MSDFDRVANARAIMAQNIDSDSLGSRLTSAARERAIAFAVRSWTGNVGAGEAAKAGIRSATADVLKP